MKLGLCLNSSDRNKTTNEDTMPLAPLSPGHQRSFKARPLNKRVM